ncbi:hypothetical protein, partial [Undibacterium sp.]|uniref:hypothetical protein n=1 Tax=Undibacterium sp. TaxID=1914977 RepID=UPI00273212AA
DYLFIQFCVAALCALAAEKRDYEALLCRCQHPVFISFSLNLLDLIPTTSGYLQTRLSASFLSLKPIITSLSSAPLFSGRRTIANLRGTLQEKFTFTAKLTKNELRLCI